MSPRSSRLPGVGTTIFARMSAHAAACGAINLSQGFPDFDPDPALIEAVAEAMRGGHNQYAPMPGLLALRQVVAEQHRHLHGSYYDPESEVTITSGGTEALFAALAAATQPGDEVIVFDPAYDSYDPAIWLCGCTAVHLPLSYPEFGIDWQRVSEAITPRTRALVINSPHNPSGAVIGPADVAALLALIERHDLLIVSDEVYEFLIFEGVAHLSMGQIEALRARAFVVGSFGKSLHATGWKVGYVCAPAELTAELRRVHQYLTFATHTPTQVGIARYLGARPDYPKSLAAFYQQKRDFFAQRMGQTRLKALPARGTYFQLYEYGDLHEGAEQVSDTEMALWLTEHAGVASIPISVFYADGLDRRVLRFCFAKKEETLAAAAERLSRVSASQPPRA